MSSDTNAIGDSTAAIIAYFLTWLPLLLVAGVWLFICWKQGVFRRGAMSQSRYLEEILNETKRHNAVLEALMTKMDARLPQVESDTQKHNL
jgi:hypothetical protein